MKHLPTKIPMLSMRKQETMITSVYLSNRGLTLTARRVIQTARNAFPVSMMKLHLEPASITAMKQYWRINKQNTVVNLRVMLSSVRTVFSQHVEGSGGACSSVSEPNMFIGAMERWPALCLAWAAATLLRCISDCPEFMLVVLYYYCVRYGYSVLTKKWCTKKLKVRRRANRPLMGKPCRSTQHLHLKGGGRRMKYAEVVVI